MRVRLFIVFTIVAILIGYLTYKQHQDTDEEGAVLLADGVRASNTTVMTEPRNIRIWNHRDRLAYYANGTVGIVAPRGKGQPLYQSDDRMFIDGFASYIVARDSSGVHITTRNKSFTLPNSHGENTHFVYQWQNGLLYYALYSRGGIEPSFTGLYAYNPATGEERQLVPGKNSYTVWGLDISPDSTKIILVMEQHPAEEQSPTAQEIWIYDLRSEEIKQIHVLQPAPDAIMPATLHGSPYWINPTTVAINLRKIDSDEQVGMIFYSYNGELLTRRRIFMDGVKLLAYTGENQVFLLQRELNVALGDLRDAYIISSYDLSEGQLLRVMALPRGQVVALTLFHVRKNKLLVALVPTAGAPGKEASQISLLDVTGKEVPLFSTNGTIMEATWVGNTLYAVIFNGGTYTLQRIAFSGW
ncbi:MAG: hypothetical protein DDT36_00806 [Firmicutes bacterium]|nr:hypothetical protein [Bacillota bacterium]